MSGERAEGHASVLLAEAVEGLAVKSHGCYVDATFGRGGHSAAVLDRLGPEGRLIAIDKDPEAVEAARRRFGADPRFTIRHGSFAGLGGYLEECGLLGRVDGLLLDLGVSSPQLDEARRGFSFLREGPLDMRMDVSRGLSAAEWLARVEVGELARVLRRYGEERHAGRIARAIVAARESGPIRTTTRLAAVIAEAMPGRPDPHKHPATRSFQAIRIFLNRELEDLERVLADAPAILARGGRLVAISFHSLEDRMVKRFMKQAARPGADLPARLPVPASELRASMRLIGRARRAGEAEIEANPRARSAVLRIAERR